MNKEQLSNIFDEFYKADESRHDFDSSGLGMPIAKRIVEKHNGTIEVESPGPGKGTSFHIQIPKNDNKMEKNSK
jgi:signal transduction histidine kinase